MKSLRVETMNYSDTMQGGIAYALFFKTLLNPD